MKDNRVAIAEAAAASGPSQIARKAIIALAITLACAFLFVSSSYEVNGGFIHETIEWIGVVLIVVCILGRTWSVLYIGGRKNSELVTDGPYSICRNPLYTFSIIGSIGVGAQFGSVTVAFVCGFFTWSVFHWTVLREEATMAVAFPEQFPAYVERVPRFLPRIALWTTPATITVRPRTMITTFFDALIFLTAIPLMEIFEYFHDSGTLPVLFKLP